MPAQGLWAVQQTELARSASAQRLRAGIFRHIQSITFLLHISTPNLHFLKLSYCNLKYLTCSTLSGFWIIRLEKIAEKFCWIKTTSKHCGKTMSTYWHQKTINGDRRCFPWALCSGCSDLLAPPSSFIRIWHDTMLLTLGFNMCNFLIQLWKAPLTCNVMTTHTSVVRSTSMFTHNVYCDVTNFAPFELSRHVGADKHHLLWNILTKVVPGLMWMRADMTVYQPGNFLCNLLIKKSTYVIKFFITCRNECNPMHKWYKSRKCLVAAEAQTVKCLVSRSTNGIIRIANHPMFFYRL